MSRTLTEYIGWVLKPFFAGWWSVFTGLASLVAFALTPEDAALSGASALLMTFAVSVLLFLTASVMIQGWKLYAERERAFEVVSFQKASVPEHGGEWIVQLRGPMADTGSVLQMDRQLSDGHETPFALIRLTGRNAEGLHQAIPLWLSAGGLNDYRKRASSVLSFRVARLPTFDCLERVLQETRR